MPATFPKARRTRSIVTGARGPSSRFAMHLRVAALAALLPALSHATPILGKANVTGAVTLTSTTIDFMPLAGGSGAILVEPFTQTGSFVPLAGSAGALLDLSSAGQPVGVPFVLANFLTIAADPATQRTLTFIYPGVFSAANCGAAPAAGQTCTPVGAAFNFANTTATSSVLSFSMHGTMTNAADTTQFAAALTAQFSAMNYQTVLATLLGGGSVSAAFSADFYVTAAADEADLEITKTDGALVALAGAAHSYTIVVSNAGPSAVIGAAIADVFPAIFTGATYTSTAAGGATGNTAAGSGDISDSVFMPAGSSITYQVSGTIDPAAAGVLSNTATAAPPVTVTDPDLSDNSATDTTLLQAPVAPVPTMQLWGLLALALVLAVAGLWALRPA
jgi:uncharacterized repeat protein (TIGR01451 family)